MRLVRDNQDIDEPTVILTHGDHLQAMIEDIQGLLEELKTLSYKKDKKEVFQVLGDIEELRHMVIRNLLPKDQRRAEIEYHKLTNHSKDIATKQGGFFKQLAKE